MVSKELKARILADINKSLAEGPKKAGELITEVISEYWEELPVGFECADFLDGLVVRNEILEVEYVTEDMDYRIKSLYFSAKTVIRIVNLLGASND